MKTPLRFQVTEFDCGSVSLVNCLTYLFDREKIPAELIREISIYTLDCYDSKGNLGQGGTSREAVEKISSWMNDYCNRKDFGLHSTYLRGDQVDIDKIRTCVSSGGVANVRSFFEVEHYVILTGIDKKFVYIWDPYYVGKTEFKDDKAIKVDFKHPFSYNRIVSIERFLSTDKKSFALGPIEKREVLLMKGV